MKRITVLLLAASVVVSGCTGGKWVRTTVAEQYDYGVVLEQYQEKGGVVHRSYEHPYEIDVSRLGRVMKDLRYLEEGGLMGTEKRRPVFQEMEIDRLAPVLADALAKADAGQRIRFISFNQGKTWIFSTPRKTEGVIFVEPADRLNIAFNYINAKRHSSESTATDAVYSVADPLNIDNSDTPLTAVVPYAKLHRSETGGRAPMWIVADLEQLKKSTGSSPHPVAPREETTPDVPPEAVMKSAPAEKTAPVQAPENRLEQEIKNKLRFLKELLDEGLIDEEDYAAKKKELLDNID